ncbi:probable disease resistance protein At1g61300 isoform X2 [Punica granatum]|nr:probable disease resistance protein At1g61300 isoform X2 [Punica granatum]
MVEAAAAALAVEAYRDGRNLISYVTKKLDYADDLEKNYKRLTEEADKLFARRADVEAQVRKDMMKRITKECDAWISRVRVIEQEVLELENEFKKGTKRTWRKRRILSRSTLSRRMANKCEELHSLWAEGRVETDVVVEKPPEPVRVINSPRTENKPSLHWAIEEIRGHLRDRNVKRIGLWGTLGIGKTTIMHNLNNDEEIANMFDIVISVSVSEDNSIEKLQRAILRRLKLNVEGNNDQSEVAWRISKELENKRYLFLLDEVSETLELHRVGIPEDEMDSKVVLASRYEHVCYDMEVDEFVNVKRLSDFDAWKMFREKVGRNINLPGVEEIARLVVNECAGLPLLIDRVARNFRKKDNINLWRDGLRSLRRWPDIKVQGMEEVLEFLKFCYDDLDDETQKICFLYSALYPEEYDIFVDYLLECWKARGFICDVVDFLEARDRGHSILSDLLDVSLLERSKKMKHVRMNKVIRNMALKISSDSKDSTFLVKAREGLQEPPTEEEWKGVSGISLMDNKLHSLPEAVDCEDLRTLLLQRNHELTLIPESFFQSMPKLQVLDLHGCGCRSLPSSISSLTSLTALYLNSCRDLMELPADMKALRKLEVLDIRGSGINYLPVQIGHLLQLRCLRISLSNSCIGSLIQGQSRFAQISQNIISRLRWLEELTIDVDPHNQWWDGVVKTITKEVATLTRLTSLSFCFPSVDCLKIFVTSSSLWKNFSFTFRFSVGYHECTSYQILEHFEYEISRCLKYADGEGVDHAIKKVLAEADAFELIRHKGISSISEFGIESINKMRGCLIEGCTDIEFIIDGTHATEPSLGCLEKMVIKNAPRLASIFAGPVHSGSLGRLTTLSIYKCPKLLMIFSCGVIQQLSELQHLRVEECHEIREIIMRVENSILEPGSLPKLKTLILIDLPKLRSIWVDNSLEWASLEGITVYMCQSLIRLPFGKSNASNLRYIKGQRMWWRMLEWEEDGTEGRLQSLCIFSQ